MSAPVRCRVAAKRVDTADVVTLDLVPVDAPVRDKVDQSEPGQFLMLYAFGAGEVPISVSGCAVDDGVLRHTIRAVGGVTEALCALEVGAMVGARGPFGVGWPVDAAEGHDLVVMGGGIGLAPLRPVIRRVLAKRGRFGRVTVVAGAKTPGDLLYAAEFGDWRAADIDLLVTVDRADPADAAAAGAGAITVGLVTDALPQARFDPGHTVAMLCGPEIMMTSAVRLLLDRGLAAERVFVSLERNMQCGERQCGHCQLGPLFVCADGPVVSWAMAEPLLAVPRW